jgi:hypothetical protein
LFTSSATQLPAERFGDDDYHDADRAKVKRGRSLALSGRALNALATLQAHFANYGSSNPLRFLDGALNALATLPANFANYGSSIHCAFWMER